MESNKLTVVTTEKVTEIDVKEARKKYAQEYYQKNKKRIKERQKLYRQVNRKKVLEREREYRRNNPEKVKKWNENYWRRKAAELTQNKKVD